MFKYNPDTKIATVTPIYSNGFMAQILTAGYSEKPVQVTVDFNINDILKLNL